MYVLDKEGKEKYYYSENLEIYADVLNYYETKQCEIKQSDIVDLYIHHNCIELYNYVGNTYEEISVDPYHAIDGRSLRLTFSYDTALELLNEFDYELYAKGAYSIRANCLYLPDRDDYFERLYLGKCIREIWTKKEDSKPFRFDEKDL